MITQELRRILLGSVPAPAGVMAWLSDLAAKGISRVDASYYWWTEGACWRAHMLTYGPPTGWTWGGEPMAMLNHWFACLQAWVVPSLLEGPPDDSSDRLVMTVYPSDLDPDLIVSRRPDHGQGPVTWQVQIPYATWTPDHPVPPRIVSRPT